MLKPLAHVMFTRVQENIRPKTVTEQPVPAKHRHALTASLFHFISSTTSISSWNFHKNARDRCIGTEKVPRKALGLNPITKGHPRVHVRKKIIKKYCTGTLCCIILELLDRGAPAKGAVVIFFLLNPLFFISFFRCRGELSTRRRTSTHATEGLCLKNREEGDF